MAKKVVKAEASLFTVDEYKENFKPNKKKKEAKIQVEVCEYLKKYHPDVMFQCDLASGMNLGKHIGGMNSRLRSSRGLPDLFIMHSAQRKFDSNPKFRESYSYHGLFIELKRDGKSPYLKNGSLSKDEHVQEQAAILERLKSQGYKAEFAVGYDEAVKIISEYLS